MTPVAYVVAVLALAAFVTLIYLLCGLRRPSIALSAPCGPTPRTSLADDTHGCVHDGTGTPVVPGGSARDRSRGTFDNRRLLAEMERGA